MISTRITELFGIEHPVVQCAAGQASGPELVAAVANAGGLGLLPAGVHDTPEELALEIDRTAALTNKPFGLSFGFLVGNRNVEPEAFFEVAKSKGVAAIELSSSNSYLYTDFLKKLGIIVIHSCKTVKDARSSEKAGCDAVVLEGVEGLGLRSDLDVTSMVLVPACAGGLRVPVIASGGIADGRGLVAALALGADGVAMTTRFLMTAESAANPGVKGYLMRALEGDTILVGGSPNKSQRVLKTPVSEKLYHQKKWGDKIETPKLDSDPLITGDFSSGLLSVGQSIGLISDLPTVDELMERIVEEARATQKRFQLLFR